MFFMNKPENTQILTLHKVLIDSCLQKSYKITRKKNKKNDTTY